MLAIAQQQKNYKLKNKIFDSNSKMNLLFS